MRSALGILVCSGLILIGTAANIMAGPRKPSVNLGTTRTTTRFRRTSRSQGFSTAVRALHEIREFGDPHHSARACLAILFTGQVTLPVEWRQKCKKFPRLWLTL
jgi:hypothetical protein